MKYIVYLLIWMNCSCPSNSGIYTPVTETIYEMPHYSKASCAAQIKYMDSLDLLLDQMAKEQNIYGLVQSGTVPDRIYKITLRDGKVIDSTPVDIEPVIERSKKWVEEEKETIKGFKVK